MVFYHVAVHAPICAIAVQYSIPCEMSVMDAGKSAPESVPPPDDAPMPYVIAPLVVFAEDVEK